MMETSQSIGSAVMDPAVATAARRNDEARLYWVCQVGGWGGFCAFNAWTASRLMHLPPLMSIVDYGVAFVLLIGGTHALRLYSKRHRWLLLSLRALVIHVLIASVVLAVTLLGIALAISAAFASFGFELRLSMDQPRLFAIGIALINFQVYSLIWMALYFGFTVQRHRQKTNAEEARLRAALRTAELGLLKSQLNPHFLFNALNTVRALIVESPERAQLAVTQLARTLRYSLNSSRDELVSLETELAIVDDYLGIETLRLAERLTIDKSVSPDTLATQIPIMLLQTLVENAVKHGISQLPQGGVLKIATRRENTVLVIEVQNDRPLIKSGSIPSDRVGLANASERLRLMIGPQASLKLDLSDPRRAMATVRIPQSLSSSTTINKSAA